MINYNETTNEEVLESLKGTIAYQQASDILTYKRSDELSMHIFTKDFRDALVPQCDYSYEENIEKECIWSFQDGSVVVYLQGSGEYRVSRRYWDYKDTTEFETFVVFGVYGCDVPFINIVKPKSLEAMQKLDRNIDAVRLSYISSRESGWGMESCCT